MTEPTDAEIDALWVGQQLTVPQLVQRRVIASAALAKWGSQPVVVREPLTDEQIRAMAREYPAEDLCGWSYRMGIADTERHYGIKGGQHGADTRSN